jgi:purine-binding chemotaxis protein CheW
MSTHVRVRVGAENYALPVEHVKEVTRLGRLTPMPGSSAAVVGISNLRGEIVPVYDLAVLLGIETTAAGSRVLIAEAGGRRFGLVVEEVCDVADLPPATEQTDSRLLHGAALIGDDLVGFVDVGALLETLQMTPAV